VILAEGWCIPRTTKPSCTKIRALKSPEIDSHSTRYLLSISILAIVWGSASNFVQCPRQEEPQLADGYQRKVQPKSYV